MKAPCKECKERNEGCHSRCEKYTAFRKECDEEIKRRALRQEQSYVGWLKYKKAKVRIEKGK